MSRRDRRDRRDDDIAADPIISIQGGLYPTDSGSWSLMATCELCEELVIVTGYLDELEQVSREHYAQHVLEGV